MPKPLFYTKDIGSQRSESTPGEISYDTEGHRLPAQWSMSQEPPASYTASAGGAIPETPTSTHEG